MEVYVDEMLVRSKIVGEHLHNLSLMFGILKEYRMRLNLPKCAFSVSSGKFLSFMISQKGIEANVEKITAIIDMEKLKTQKDVQSLTGRIAALTNFISKATDKCVPFFKALKGGKHHVSWTAECDKSNRSSMSAKRRASVPSLRIASPSAHHLRAKTLFVLPSARDYSLNQSTALASAPELGEFDVQFKLRPTEKGQAVADFISELTPSVTPEPAISRTNAEETG
ncbi:hypothetical protein L3X38_042244 [Prunus dulcis]|uniref:Reverse transcriptase domain-containing protein n=1 Tax=Prunus dulcis TaxID=3755 RepID=A0AAD4UUH5_PRUDU|nr:hypothetical protein L3X38_042244 [Prunus dulcis]